MTKLLLKHARPAALPAAPQRCDRRKALALARRHGRSVMTFPLPFIDPGVKYAAPGSQTFSVAGAQSFTIPRYKNTLTIELWGAGGGGGTNGGNGGAGGASTVASLSLSAGGGGAGIGTSSNGAGGVASGGDVNTNGGAGSGSTAGAAANSGPGVGGSGGYYTYTATEGPIGDASHYWRTTGSYYEIWWGGYLGQFTPTSDTTKTIGGVTYYRWSTFPGDYSKFTLKRTYTAGAYGRAGGGGAYVSKTFAKGALTVGAVLALIIGAAGSSYGSAPGAGRIKITWT